MSNPLEVVRRELKILRPRIKILEQTERLLSLTYESPEPGHTEKQAKKPGSDIDRPAPRKRTGQRKPTGAEVRDYIIAHAPITRARLVREMGADPEVIDNRLKRLFADGAIGAEGSRRSRRYLAPGERPEIVAVPDLGGPSGVQDIPARGVYPVYDVIIDHDGATTEQLTKLTGLPASRVVEEGRRLVQLGLIRFRGVGAARVWLPWQSKAAGDSQ